MDFKLSFICGLLLVAASATAQSNSSQDKTTKGTGAQIVSTAEILKIDAKKKSLQVRELVEPKTGTGERTGQRSGRGRGGGGGGGGRGGGRRGGGGIGFPGGGGGAPRTNQPKEYKVFVSNDTVMQFAGVDIDFANLHVSDRITVSGTPKGGKGDIDAKTITRQ